MRISFSIRVVLLGSLVIVLAGGLALLWLVRTRMSSCQPVPLLSAELLPNANLSDTGSGSLPSGWQAAAPGVELRQPALDTNADGSLKGGFDLDNDGRSLQLLGIGNYVETPAIPVTAGASYCFTARALTDSLKQSATRVRLTFRWLDVAGNPLQTAMTDWQPVVLWTPEAAPRDWSRIVGGGAAPAGATALRVRIQPASDDRIYLDLMHAQRTFGADLPTLTEASQRSPLLAPWPQGARAAVSFSFDWETTMGGLIHSRSVDDPNSDQDPVLRGLRMRQGVTNTLELFRPLGIRATYYANGYNFLSGNPERRMFMGNPTFAWATAANGWNDTWAQQPWFSLDPYTTLSQSPAWYFADLLPMLRAAGQDIQSHTFSHLHVGLAATSDWRTDLQTWRELASESGTPPATSVAFPWSSSAGMSDADWQALTDAGITSVTRTNWSLRQNRLVDREQVQCTAVPGHESVLACPDFYLIGGRELKPSDRVLEALAGGGPAEAQATIDRAIQHGGMIDIWAHTEEVTSPEQIAAWRTVVDYAAQQHDAGAVWIAPLAEIASWQQALSQVSVTQSGSATQGIRFTITNNSHQAMDGLTLTLPMAAASVDGPAQLRSPSTLVLPALSAGQTLEVTVWPA